MLNDGDNFAVIAVDNTRLADGVPTLQTDWWNYGGITRDVSLVEVPQEFIDNYSMHLKRGSATDLEGWVHVEGAAAGTAVNVSIAELSVHATGKTGADGRAPIEVHAVNLQRWSPEHPKLYSLEIQAGENLYG